MEFRNLNQVQFDSEDLKGFIELALKEGMRFFSVDVKEKISYGSIDELKDSLFK